MLPRGIRNNNPLNIRRTKDQWLGMKKEQTGTAGTGQRLILSDEKSI